MAESTNDPAAQTRAPFPGILVSDRFREAYGYSVSRPRGTRDWLITFTLSGEGVYRIGDEATSCRPGDVAILTPGTPHDYATAPGSVWEFVWTHFLPYPHWSRWLQLPKTPGGLIYLHIADAKVRSRIEGAFQRIFQDSVTPGAYFDDLALNALEEVLILVAQANVKSAKAGSDPRIQSVLHLLSQHMAEPHRIDELAAKVNLSPSRLAHLFKEQTGDSIIETLNKLRLRQAARLLAFTSRQIAEIAEDVGYRSAFYFTKQFTAFYGMSPSAYRKKLQHDDKTLREAADGGFIDFPRKPC